MVTISRNGVRAIVFGLLAMIFFALDVEMAHAQSSQCNRLVNALQQFDRNSDFRQFDGNSQAARQLQRDVQNAESRYIREGCNDDAKAGRTLTRQCQQIAREVLRLRYWEELSVAEMATVLQLSSGAVRVRLHRARQQLKPMLTSHSVPRREP